MAVKNQPNIRGTHLFYPQGLGRVARVAGDNRGILSLLIAPACTAHTPTFVSVDSQAKVSFSRFKYNRRSKTFNNQIEHSKRSVQPLSTPIRLVITCITPSTVALLNVSDLQPDGSPYVEVPWKDGISSSTGVKNENLR